MLVGAFAITVCNSAMLVMGMLLMGRVSLWEELAVQVRVSTPSLNLVGAVVSAQSPHWWVCSTSTGTSTSTVFVPLSQAVIARMINKAVMRGKSEKFLLLCINGERRTCRVLV